MKTLHLLIIGIVLTTLSAMIIFFVLFQDQVDKRKTRLDDMGDVNLDNFFSDNVTRIATMQINKKNDGQGLSANMLIHLTVVGKTSAIHVYPIVAPWSKNTTTDVVFEDEDHRPIQIKPDCNYNCGSFLQLLVIPECITEQGELAGGTRMTDDAVILTHNNIYNSVFAKYSLSDILPENGQYSIKFVSPYYVKINLPKDSIVLSNHTTTCTFTLDQNKRAAFSADVTFKLG